MNKNDPPYALYPSRIDMPAEIRIDVIKLLNQTLACTVDLRSQVKQACWNVKGKDFYPLHALFITMATELETYIELMAERVAMLGGAVLGTIRAAVMLSKLPEYPEAIVDGDAHILALTERFAYYSMTLRDDIVLVTDLEDAGTAAVYTDISRGVDKQLWVLEAHLHR